MAYLLLGLILVAVAGGGGYFLVAKPILRAQADEQTLNGEIAELEDQLQKQKQAQKRLAVARVRSLPADEALARREYIVALERLIEAAGVPKGYTISPKAADNSGRAVPEISKGKPMYTRVAYEVILKKTDTAALKEFLQSYYQLGLLHQITSIYIKKEDDPGAKNAGKRNDLTVTLTTEAIIVDGADNRKTLLAVPTAYAAVGGGAIYKGLTLSPEVARGVRAHLLAPVLSTANRDYDLIVLKDPFCGPLPPSPPFRLDKISDLKVKPDEKPSPVKVPLKGEGAVGAKITAIASGSLFAEGALKVDPKTGAIELPATSATEGAATISVLATSADGQKTEKTTFRVSVDETQTSEAAARAEDISPFVILIGTAPRSDGTAWARVNDNANRFRYEIDVTAKGVSIIKEWSPSVDRWKKDLDYDHPPGVLHISAENTRTDRTFKVIAVDTEGLVLADLKPNSHKNEPQRPGKGKGPRPGPPRQGRGNPLAALGGNMIVAVAPTKLYRWEVGQSLAKIQEIPEEEARKILQAARAAGGEVDMIASGR